MPPIIIVDMDQKRVFVNCAFIAAVKILKKNVCLERFQKLNIIRPNVINENCRCRELENIIFASKATISIYLSQAKILSEGFTLVSQT